MNIPMTARQVLESYWDGALPVKLVAIANAMGISVFKSSVLSSSGQVGYDENNRIKIVLKEDESVVRRRFTLAHEIGHVALGHVSPGAELYRDDPDSFFLSTRDPNEVAANKFAAQLLMPAEQVRLLFDSREIKSITEMAEIFKVSEVAMHYRLKNLGLLHG